MARLTPEAEARKRKKERRHAWEDERNRTHLANSLEKARVNIRRRGGNSLMSNTKWQLLFSVLKDPGLDIRQLRVKFISNESARDIGVPRRGTPPEFFDALFDHENGVSFGAFPLVAIEWLEIDAIAQLRDYRPPLSHTQNLVEVRKRLAETGKSFPIEETAEALRIVGHRF